MWALIRFESRKFFFEKRSLLGLLTIVTLNLLFAAAFYMRSKHGGDPHPLDKNRLIGDFMNAYTYTQTILSPSVYLLFPMDIAILGSYMLAGEVELGSLRMMLFRPVHRWQILWAKFIVLGLYSFILVTILGVLSYLTACTMMPAAGDVMIPGPLYMLQTKFVIHPAAEAPMRILLTYLLAVPMLVSVGAMTLMFALVLRHYTAAAVATSTVYFCSYVVQGIPFLSAVHPYLPTRYLPFWRYALLVPIPWERIAVDACWTGVYALVFMGLATALFSLRDI